jgi:hypothetical protein
MGILTAGGIEKSPQQSPNITRKTAATQPLDPVAIFFWVG